MYMCAPACFCAPCVCRCLWKPEEHAGSPGARVISGYKLPNVDAGTKPVSSARVIGALNLRAILPTRI